MNTKTAVGILVAIIILVVAFFAFHKSASAPTPVPTGSDTVATSTSPALPTATASSSTTTLKPTTKPDFQFGSSTLTHAPVYQLAADASSLASLPGRPTITGTASANIATIGIILKDSTGRGLVGTSDVPVEKGHWSYTPPLALDSGTYTLELYAGTKVVTASLVIQ